MTVFVVRIVQGFFRLLRWFLEFLLSLVPAAPPAPSPPAVTDFQPRQGWPGSILDIDGTGFASTLDGNVVEIGGTQALVMEAVPTRLTVLALQSTATGPIVVSVGGSAATSTDSFEVLPYPAPDDVSRDGAPLFFEGPLHGTPSTGVQNQRVLVAFAYPTDQNPGGGGAALRTSVVDRFNQADTFWNEATYNQTTWSFESTPWFPLPSDHRTYFWGPADIVDARRALLEQTTANLASAGNVILFGSGSGIIPLDYPPAGTSVTFHPGLNFGGIATAVRVAGSRGFATGGGRLHVFDVTTPTSLSTLGSVAFAGFGADVDASGNLAVVAARESGLLVFDVSTPANPTQVGSLAFGGDWATAVRLVGSTAYVGAGNRLRVVDLTTPAAPNATANLDLGGWVTGVDVAGTTCVATTDGTGLHTIELAAGGPVKRGQWQGATRLRHVVLGGTTAVVEANDVGVFLIDVSILATPSQSGAVPTSKPAFRALVRGTTAFVATGNRRLTSINISNPASPSVLRTDTLFSGTDPDLTALRNQLRQALDGQALIKDGDVFMLDALTAAAATLPAGTSLNDFQGFIIVVNGPGLRGQSWTRGAFSSNGRSLTFNEAKGRHLHRAQCRMGPYRPRDRSLVGHVGYLRGLVCGRHVHARKRSGLVLERQSRQRPLVLRAPRFRRRCASFRPSIRTTTSSICPGRPLLQPRTRSTRSRLMTRIRMRPPLGSTYSSSVSPAACGTSSRSAKSRPA